MSTPDQDLSLQQERGGDQGFLRMSIAEINAMSRLSLRQRSAMRFDLDRYETIKRAGDIEVTNEFRAALRALRDPQPLVFLTGPGGTGKSTFFSMLREMYRGNMAIVCPTGRASILVNGQTIHSFFGIKPGPIDFDSVRTNSARRDAVVKNLNLLVIDEVSMVRSDLLDAMELILRLHGPVPGRLFGGVQVLFIGDLLQLPPVVKEIATRQFMAHNYETPYFFGARCMKESGADLAIVELTRPFRQKDEAFYKLLCNIRKAESLEESLAQINESCFRPVPTDQPCMVLTTLRRHAEALNMAQLDKLRGSALCSEARFSQGFKAPQLEDFPAPVRLQLKEGALVVFTRNDPEKQWVNGTMGIVRYITPDAIGVEITGGGAAGVCVEVNRVRWESFEYQYEPEIRKIVTTPRGFFEQFPLMPAWAMTIHKAQGATLDRVCINLGQGAFATGQTYVALSRCRDIKGLYLDRPLCESDVRAEPGILDFYRVLSARG